MNTVGSVGDLKIINESLYKENLANEREISKLNKDVQQYKQTTMSLRNELSLGKYHNPDLSKKEVSVMSEISDSMAGCGDREPVKDEARGDLAAYQERIQKKENAILKTGNNIRALRSANVMLHEEVVSLRGKCAALEHIACSHELRDQFKDDIIREMRRQLKQVKQQSKEVSERLSNRLSLSASLESRVTGTRKSRDSREKREAQESRDQSPRRICEQPRRCDHRAFPEDQREGLSLSDERSPRLQLSVEDLLSVMPD